MMNDENLEFDEVVVDFCDWFHEKTCDNCKHAKMSKYGEVFCHWGIERRFIEDGPQMDADDTCGHWEVRENER